MSRQVISGHNVELGLLHQRVFNGVMLYLLGEGYICVHCLAYLSRGVFFQVDFGSAGRL